MNAGHGKKLLRVCALAGMALTGGHGASAAATLPQAVGGTDAPPGTAAAQPDAIRVADGKDCTPVLNLSSGNGAMIKVALSAPCRPAERVVVRHAGLAVTYKTGRDGSLEVVLPALAGDAQVSVMFAGGETVGAPLAVPGAAAFRRFGVQWPGARFLALSAFEPGDGNGETRQVLAAKPGKAKGGAPAAGGFLTVLGDARVERPLLAEVYTFPAGDAAVLVVVEAAITPQTCGQDLLGETISAADGVVKLSDLLVTMPACDAKGGYLVLKNLVAGTKLSASD